MVGLIHMLGSDVRGLTRYSFVRCHAALALVRLGDPRAIPYLVEMRHDPEEIVRMAVMSALGKLNATEAIDVLFEGLSDTKPLVRVSAAEALGLLGTVDAIPALRKALDSDPDRYVRLRAVESLVMLGTSQRATAYPKSSPQCHGACAGTRAFGNCERSQKVVRG